MADVLVTGDQVRDEFAKYEDIAARMEKLKTDVDNINRMNVTAGGTDDDVAKQYHQQVDIGGKALTDLVQLLRDVSGDIGDAGMNATNLLDRAEDEANTVAAEWDAAAHPARGTST